jgi:hypothetical protein
VLAGRVRDAVTQVPLAGAVVTLGDDTVCTLSQADGLFWFVEAAEASAPQYVGQCIALPVPLRAGEATTLNITLTLARAS